MTLRSLRSLAFLAWGAASIAVVPLSLLFVARAESGVWRLFGACAFARPPRRNSRRNRSFRDVIGSMKVHPIIQLFAAVLSGACATSPPAPANLQEDYFHCQGIIMDRVEDNLTKTSHRFAWSEENKEVVTAWEGFTVRSPSSEQPMRLALRLSVAATNEGVRFTIFERLEGQTEGYAWTGITEAQVSEKTTRALLNKIRRDVCGGGDFFK